MRFIKSALIGILSVGVLSGCSRGQAVPTVPPPAGQQPPGMRQPTQGYQGYYNPQPQQQQLPQQQQPQQQNEDEYWYALYEWCAENYPGYEEECVYSFYDTGGNNDSGEGDWGGGYYARR